MIRHLFCCPDCRVAYHIYEYWDDRYVPLPKCDRDGRIMIHKSTHHVPQEVVSHPWNYPNHPSLK